MISRVVFINLNSFKDTEDVIFIDPLFIELSVLIPTLWQKLWLIKIKWDFPFSTKKLNCGFSMKVTCILQGRT